MDATEQTINTFATRVRQMILQYNELKQENDRLYAMVDEKDAQVRQLEVRLAQLKNDYDMLKLAKMLTVTDGDLEVAKKRVAGLVRDVNKCITLLSEK
ncbi:hypothetical protein [Hallella colorans]|jgi:hypothetical protein|uniref:Uncharacterized protein n=1 Tax=Hallella colorans TaxID=1703337 RepID=A0A2U0U7B7_9BACT|nr:hypothetical protein [Hallella colorans]PVX53499.1 hypothetical protein C7379_11112 [Hallella colorans]